MAGGAAGDVAAGEGDLADCPTSPNGSPPGAGRSRTTAPGALRPTARSLAWIADTDGRPRAWLADLDPAGIGQGAGPAARRDLADVTALAWSPDGAWIALQVAPHGGERTGVHLVDPATGEVRDLAPGAAAATLGAWAPTGRVVGVTVFPEGSGDGQACLVDVARRHVHGARGRARRAGVRGVGRRAARRGPAGPPRRPPPGAGRPAHRAAHRADPRRRGADRRRPVRRHGPPALRAHRRRARAGRAARRHAARHVGGVARCSPSPSGPTTTSTWSRSTRRARAPRSCGTSTGAARPSCWTCAPGTSSRSPPRRARSSPAWRSPAPATALLIGSEGPDRRRRGSRTSRSTTPPSRRRCWPPSRRRTRARRADAAHVPGRGRARPVRVAVPAARGARPAAHAAVAARRPGGPGAARPPAAVPGAVRGGVAVFAPNVRGSGGYGRSFAAADDLAPPVRRDHRRARGGDVPRRGGAGRPGARRAWRAAPTAATSPWPRWPASRSSSPSASTCAGSPTSPRSTPPPSRGSRRRPPRSTATRRPTPTCCARSPRSTRSTGSPRRCWSCTGRTTRTCRSWRPSRSSRRCATAAPPPGFLLFDDEGHEVHGVDNRARVRARGGGVGARPPLRPGRADGLRAHGQPRLNDSMSSRRRGGGDHEAVGLVGDVEPSFWTNRTRALTVLSPVCRASCSVTWDRPS